MGKPREITTEGPFPSTASTLSSPVIRQFLRDHPHDSRGALSYLVGGRGAYGYLITTTVEGEALQKIFSNIHDGKIRIRCSVPETEIAVGGLTIYGTESGRYPLPLVLMVES